MVRSVLEFPHVSRPAVAEEDVPGSGNLAHIGGIGATVMSQEVTEQQDHVLAPVAQRGNHKTESGYAEEEVRAKSASRNGSPGQQVPFQFRSLP
jgi:hypothetical protein